jgi:hypothetical protein
MKMQKLKRNIGALHIVQDDGIKWCVQTKAATFCGGRGSAEMADALKCDLFLSIQRCSQAQQTRSLPPWAGIGKVGVLERTMFHPKDEITPGANWLQGD